jgi:wobble nucleotide-excising tRNase
VMAQNLYFHALADNRGVMIKLADRAAEEDVKEEMLLYGVLAKTTVNRSDLVHVDNAIERYLKSTFEIDVDFDLNDALDRLIADGIVTEEADGTLRTLSPAVAAKHIDDMWDGFLDHLTEDKEDLGVELDAGTEGQRVG